MRFHQPVGLVPQNNDYINVTINVNNPESRFLIGNKTNNQLTRINGNNFPNATESLNLTQCQSIVIEKQSENINNFDVNETTALENILKFKADSKYFKNFLDSRQTNSGRIDLDNGNNGVVFIETLNFADKNLSQVRKSFKFFFLNAS
jgi:hypothetical protein